MIKAVILHSRSDGRGLAPEGKKGTRKENDDNTATGQEAAIITGIIKSEAPGSRKKRPWGSPDTDNSKEKEKKIKTAESLILAQDER